VIRVRNATKITENGIKFDSKLEHYLYHKLKEYSIPFEYNQNVYEVLPAFKYHDEKFRSITYKPDFVNENWVIECKGFPNESWPLRKKLFLWHLHNTTPHKKFYTVRNKKEIDNLITKLIKNEQTR